MMTESEICLLRRFSLNGDAEAFAQITRRYAGMVYGTCSRITGNQEAAADAAQDTFFHLLKNARTVSGSVGGWLHRVAVRRAVDLVRQDHARRQREQAYVAETAFQTDRWADISPVVDEAMDELDDDSRDLLVRHFLQGETTVQIAAVEGLSQPTISRRVSDALERLRDKLRTKGLLVGATTLAALIVESAVAVPGEVLAELGKMAVAGKGAAATAGTAVAGVASGFKFALGLTAVVLVAGLGALLAYKQLQQARAPKQPSAVSSPSPNRSASPGWSAQAVTPGKAMAAVPVAPSAGAAATGVSASGTADVQPPAASSPRLFAATRVTDRGAVVAPQAIGGGGGMGFGGVATARPAVGPATTPEVALHHLASALAGGDLMRIRSWFVPGASGFDDFRRAWDRPANEAERSRKRCLQSLSTPIEILTTTPAEDGLKVRWSATARKSFALVENGVTNIWQAGDRYELETDLRQVGKEWRVVQLR